MTMESSAALPAFPNFAPLSPDLYAAYRERYARLSAPYCDFSLSNLLIWMNQRDDLALSAAGECLVLRFSSVFDDNRRGYALFGTGDVERAVREVLPTIAAEGEEATLCMVPDETVALIGNKDGLHIEEESRNVDYILDTGTARALKGSDYGNLRRRLNLFRKLYPDAEPVELDLHDRKTNELVRQSVEAWASEYPTKNDPEGLDLRAIAKHLNLATSMPVHARGLAIGGKLASVSLYHYPPHKGWLIFNHLRCDGRYRGVFGYSLYRMIDWAHANGTQWINIEQDLGKPGLRRIKSLFRPHHLLRRYSVSLTG
jgi:hypothetical protein